MHGQIIRGLFVFEAEQLFLLITERSGDRGREAARVIPLRFDPWPGVKRVQTPSQRMGSIGASRVTRLREAQAHSLQ